MLGDWGFRRLTLRTDARALVPRPETEVVVERCLALLAGVDAPRVLDVGTGTGAIALALKDERPGARVLATDVSTDALELARENAEATGLDVEFRESDLLDGTPVRSTSSSRTRRTCTRASSRALEPEVRDWEPRGALVDEGPDEVGSPARRASILDGWLVLEVHERRGGECRLAARGVGVRLCSLSRDLAGRPRVGGGAMELDERRDGDSRGRPVVFPTDTVYGLVTSAYEERFTEGLYRLKGRDATQPSALMAGDVETLFDCVPELRDRAGVIVRALLPGPYTLVLAESRAAISLADRNATGGDRRARARPPGCGPRRPRPRSGASHRRARTSPASRARRPSTTSPSGSAPDARPWSTSGRFRAPPRP